MFPADFEEKVDELGKSTASMVEFCCDCVDIDMDNLEEGDAAEFVYFFCLRILICVIIFISVMAMRLSWSGDLKICIVKNSETRYASF